MALLGTKSSVRASVIDMRDSLDQHSPPAPAQFHPTEFEVFYRTQAPDVYRTLGVVLRDIDLAREAVDEAMTRAYERWKTVAALDNPTGWVYRVALNWSRSRMRRGTREALIAVPDKPTHDGVHDPALDQAIARLPMPQREVVVFRYLLDLTQEDTAAVLDIPIGTVKSRLHRALASLRTEVG